jgi:hypothetical protein
MDLIDCVLLLERISKFRYKEKLKRFFDISAYKVTFVLFLVANMANMTLYLIYSVRDNSEFELIQRNYTLLASFVYCERTPFFQTTTGKIFFFVVNALKDGLIIVLQNIFAAFFITFFKDYIKDSSRSLNLTTISSNNLGSVQPIQTIQQAQPIQQTNNSEISKRVFTKIERYNLKLSLMTVYLSIASIITHLILIISAILTVLNVESITTRYFAISTLMVGLLKLISNFFLFWHFNKGFRQYFRNCFLDILFIVFCMNEFSLSFT